MATDSKDQTVPVKIKIVSFSADVLTGPGNTYKKVGELSAGESAAITLVREKYYRIRAESGLIGYVDKSHCETTERGQVFRVTIPAKATQDKSLSYQIFAMDNFGNESQTEIQDVRLINEQELLNLQKQAGIGDKESAAAATRISKKSKPFYTRPWFWITAAAVGGGAYYFLSSGEDDKNDKNATVDIIIGW
ncbi:hypothetical protein JXO59_08570, partial [candidate division KSB1 bacterium]|nr:hypothetical protein [candidate division KSB1 bacterium]